MNIDDRLGKLTERHEPWPKASNCFTTTHSSLANTSALWGGTAEADHENIRALGRNVEADRENIRALGRTAEADRESIRTLGGTAEADRENIRALGRNVEADRENIRALDPHRGNPQYRLTDLEAQ
jgi:hypothetical protein